MKPIKVIIDCDPGHDDAIALLMAHRLPEIELVAVTTVCGNAPLARTTINARRIMELLGASDVPIAAGCASPLARPLVLGTADGPSGLDGSPYLPEPTVEAVPVHGVDFLAAKLREAEEPIVLVPTGPLTNIGMLVLKYPELLSKIEKVVLMGGKEQENKHTWPRRRDVSSLWVFSSTHEQSAPIKHDEGVWDAFKMKPPPVISVTLASYYL